MSDSGKIIKDLSLLYELSLAVGSSLETQENCESFLKVLMARKNLSAAVVWLKDESGHFMTPFCLPESLNKDIKPGDFAACREKCGDKPFMVFETTDPMAQRYSITGSQGNLAIFPLGDFGCLELLNPKAGGWSIMELNQLINVIKKFAVSMAGCIAHESLLAETQMRIKAQKAERQFLAAMSHEIRNPMHAVIGTIDILKDTPLSEEQTESINSLKYSSDLLLSLLDNVLDLSKIEANELPLIEKDFDLHYLLYSVFINFENRARVKPIKMVYNFSDPPLNYIVGDSTRINQIFMNLLGNAVKFTKEGNISVSAREVEKTAEGALYEFRIKDTGIGIEPEQLDSVFDKFKQAESGIKRSYGGTGLGLAIVKELVKRMDGSIRVESEPGKGSEFILELPLRFSERLIRARLPINDGPNTEESIPKLKILAVEDDPFNRKLLSIIVKKWGSGLTMAENGAIGVQLAEQEEYDLILMDIHMPIMDGFEATTRIRETEKNGMTPIIAMTASALLEEKNRAFDSGMNAYVTKPFSSATLKKEITYVLGI